MLNASNCCWQSDEISIYVDSRSIKSWLCVSMFALLLLLYSPYVFCLFHSWLFFILSRLFHSWSHSQTKIIRVCNIIYQRAVEWLEIRCNYDNNKNSDNNRNKLHLHSCLDISNMIERKNNKKQFVSLSSFALQLFCD